MGAGAGAGISGGLGQPGSQGTTPTQGGGQSAAPTGTFTGGFGGGYDNFGGGGQFTPMRGGGGRYFSPVDQGPPQPFNINRTTPLQYQAASYPQGNLANQLASGYQQVFGRAADPSGMDYWVNKLGGQNLSQGQVNRYLLGGAAGTDVESGSDYAMSLTGGRPSLYDTSKPLMDSAGKPILDSAGKPQYEYTRQYNQPIYQPTYTNYGLSRGFYTPGYGMGLGGGFSGGGPFGAFGGGYGSGYGGYGGSFNPFSYAEGGNVYADDNYEEEQGIPSLLER